SWLKGLTKNDERVRKLVKSSTMTLKKRYASGELVSPQKGKRIDNETKRKIGFSVKKAHQEGRWAPWRQGLSGKKDANIEKINKKISSTLKKRYASGDLVAWRSKNTDQTNW